MKRALLAITAAIGLMTMNARAIDLGLFGSYWSPDDGDEVFGGGASLEIGWFQVRGTYYEDSEVPGLGELQVIPVDVGLRIGLPSSFSVVGGGSYYIIDDDADNVDNEIGWYAGGRFELPLESVSALFAEVVYRGVELEDSDADLSGIAVSVGFLFL